MWENIEFGTYVFFKLVFKNKKPRHNFLIKNIK